MNWLLYTNYPEGSQDLERVLTDKEVGPLYYSIALALTAFILQGTRRPYSVTTGSMPRSVVEGEIHPRARAKLSPQCLEVCFLPV
jgi:hypothetical protein